MNQNPFETIKDWLSRNEMSPTEKREMKQRLISYATVHPVRSGLLSPYTFRYATIALASLIIVLGGSVGITQAAKGALPNQTLYPVKIWVEELQAKQQKTPDAIIAFETKRIETRFDEANQLALKHELDDQTSTVIESGLEHSRGIIKNVADTIQNENPELALAATNHLETTFSSHGKVLAAIEQNTGQNIGTIVLAAQVTTTKLATEQVQFEQIVAAKPNIDTQSQAVTQLALLETRLTTTTTNSSSDTLPTSSATVSATTSATTTVPTLKIGAALKIKTTSATIASSSTTTAPTASDLAKQAKTKVDGGFYSEALVIIQKANQLLDEQSLTQSLESTYQVQVKDTDTSSDPSTTDASSTPASDSTDSPTTTAPVSSDTTVSANTTISTPIKTSDVGATLKASQDLQINQ